MNEEQNNQELNDELNSIELEETLSDNEIPISVLEDEPPLAGAEDAVNDQSASFQAQITELNDKVAAAEDKYLRLQADYQNFRKRSAKDITSARGYAVIDTVSPFLQVFDMFDMALTAATKTDNITSLIEGMNMIQNQFGKALEELGIEQYTATGKPFDHNLHEAVATEPSETVPEGEVVRQWNCGYKMGEQILRPARVVVSGGPKVDEE